MGSPRIAVAGSALLPVLVGLLLAACSGGRTAVVDVVPTEPATIVAVRPADGTLSVEPSSTITFTLASTNQGLQVDDVVVRDGSNRLPGTLARVGATVDWVWTPDAQLPRAATIEVGSVQQGVLATFVVRDLATRAEYQLWGEQVDTTLCWGNGRSAVHTKSGRVVEVTATGMVERLVAMPTGARAFGDGDFVGEIDVAGVHYCVRGNLDGTFDQVPTPLGVPIGEHNSAGDVVAFVPNSNGGPADHGLWRLSRSSSAFEIAGPLSLDAVDDEPSIGADGTVALAYTLPGIVRVSTFAVGDLVGLHDELAVDAVDANYDMAVDGRGVLAFGIVDAPPPPATPYLRVRAARHEPGVGLQLLPQELYAWDLSPTPYTMPNLVRGIAGVQVGELGSAVVLLEYGFDFWSGPTTPPTTNFTRYDLVRLEPDGTVGSAYHIVGIAKQLATPDDRWGTIATSPRRAEVWATTRTLTPELQLSRSRPDGVDVGGLYLFTDFVTDYSIAFDDSGRALLAGVVWTHNGGYPGTLIGSRLVVVD